MKSYDVVHADGASAHPPGHDRDIDRTIGVRPDLVEAEGAVVADERARAAGERRAPRSSPWRVVRHAPGVHTGMHSMQEAPPDAPVDRTPAESECPQLVPRDDRVPPGGEAPDALVDMNK
ncbi:MAG TPA: hypothetical protein VGF63_12125 [Solirubrobacteraceae bacterium]